LQTAVYRSLAELDAIAGLWDRAEPESPHASRRLFTHVCEAEPEAGASPYVIVLKDIDRDPIIIVGRLERAPVRVKAGYRTLLSVPARWLTIVAGGVIGAVTAEDHRAVLDALSAALRRNDADLVELSMINVDGPLHRAAVGTLPWYRRGQATPAQRHHRASLANGLEAYLAARSRNTRQRLRRRLRRLEDASAALEIRRIGPGDDSDAVGRTLDGITARSYQRGIGAGFVLDDLHTRLLAWAVADDGPFRVWILSVRGVPAAFVSGLVHGRTFFLFDTAFDASFSDEEPGGILMAKVVAELAIDPKIDALDLAFGDAQYKQSLSDESWDEVDLLFFAARPRPLALNAIRGVAASAVSAAKALLGGERIAALRRRRRAELTTAADTDG
jgi:hypothetical protein